ncbi:MAG: prephenate dehydrogenase [candidate division KSB1 bacterium]|nr:prephenate dehydrogenase [candidate division KSB1 bacterium]
MEELQFKRAAIVGVGLIGGSLALALKKKGYKGTIIGIDEPHVLEKALRRKAIDEPYPSDELLKGLSDADLVFLCTPISRIILLLQTIGNSLKPGALVTDVGSIKRKIVETANLYMPAHCDFIGGHPMAGAEVRGIDGADPFLFENAAWVLTPGKPVDEKKRRAFGDLLESIGAKVLLLQPRLHDEIAAAVSHLPQMAAVALMNMAAGYNEQSPFFLKMAAGGFRDMTRVASSPFGIWKDICSANADMIEHFIDAYIQELQKVKSILHDSHEMELYFNRAARSRLAIPTDTKGFLKPQYEISVAVEDKPGVLAALANILAAEAINIKDIEVLKIREDEGGTFRLAFGEQADQERAIELLTAAGYECRKRG